MSRKRALLIADGRAGHQRIVLGILKSLQVFEDLDASWIVIDELGKPHRSMQRLKALFGIDYRHLSYRFGSASIDFSSDFQILKNLDNLERVDYVIGAGPRSAPAVIALSKKYEARSIFFGNTRIPFLREFDVLIRFKRSYLIGSPILTHFRPHDIHPKPLLNLTDAIADCRSISVLLGGHKHWSRGSVDEFMNQILEQFPQISIDVFNSRRTPSVISSQFVENPKYSDNNRHIRFHDFQKSGFRSNSQAYANDLIFVTADSMSMISEAVSAQRPVIVIVPRGYKIPSADQIELNYFERLNHFKIWNLNRPGMPIPDISNIKIMSENHISDLSNKLFLILTGKKTGTGH